MTLTLEGLKPGETTPATIEALILGNDTDLPAVRAAAKEAVPTLVAALQSERWDPENAAEALGIFGLAAKDAIPALTQALGDDYNKVREEAATALGIFGPAAKDAVPALTQALGDDYYKTREEAATALVRILPVSEVVPVFIQLLKHENPYCATTAAEALKALGPDAKDAVPHLVQCLKVKPVYDEFGRNDKWRSLRDAATHALWYMGTASEEAVPALIEVLKHEDWHARRCAALALGRIGPAAKDAIPVLTKLANSESRDDDSRLLRHYAVEALRLIGSARVRRE